MVPIPQTGKVALSHMKDEKEQKNSVFGSILGEAIGDAIGYPVEFSYTWPKGARTLLEGNRYSDDTQMMMAVGEAILSAPPHLNLTEFMEQLGKNFVRWDNDDPIWGDNNRAPGGTCVSAVSALRRGVPWQTSGSKDNGKGNGSAMRSSIVGAAYFQNPKLAFQIGCMTAVPTHNNLEAILGAGAVSYLVASSIRGFSLAWSLAGVLELMGAWWQHLLFWPRDCRDQYPEFAIARIASAAGLARSAITNDEFRQFNGNDGKAIEAVAAAMFHNVRYTSYTSIVLNCINWTKDADTTGAISGAIAGARYGLLMIPLKWREGVENTRYLHDLANRIWQLGETVPQTASISLSKKELTLD